MTSFISNYTSNYTAARLLWAATFVVIIITFLTVFNKIRLAPQLLALHYNVVVGVDVLGGPAKLYQIPLTALAITLVNFFLIRLLRLRQPFLPILLAAASLSCALITLAAVLALYTVN